MSDPHVQRWMQHGQVFLWRYRDKPRNYPGWHLSANPRGAETLLELFRLMHNAPYSSEQVVKISDPTPSVRSVPHYVRGEDRWQAAHLWRVRYAKGRSTPSEWTIVFAGSELQLSVGETHLLALIRGAEALRAGSGDYSIAGDSADDHACMWFWPWIAVA